MPDMRDAFLQDILARPDDDVPRLVLADWLTDNGEPERGDFIRMQCAIARLNAELQDGEDCASPSCPGCAERRQLQAREEEAFRESAFWPDSLKCLVGDREITTHGWTWGYRRGFIESVRCPCQSWLDHGRHVMKHHPVLRVDLSDKQPYHQEVENYWGWLPRKVGRVAERYELPGALALAVGQYPTREVAFDILSAACIVCPRQEAVG